VGVAGTKCGLDCVDKPDEYVWWVTPGPVNAPTEGTNTFTGQVDEFGNAVILANVGQTIEITAHFAGDDPSDPTTAATSITKTIYAMAKVDEDVLGGYADDGRFRLFHKGVRPTVSTAYRIPTLAHAFACTSTNAKLDPGIGCAPPLAPDWTRKAAHTSGCRRGTTTSSFGCEPCGPATPPTSAQRVPGSTSSSPSDHVEPSASRLIAQ
jgi:hypothetical protein